MNDKERKEAEQKSVTHTDLLERQVLANMVQFPKVAFPAVEAIGICRGDFSNPTYAAAFAALLDKGPENNVALQKALVARMGDELKGQKKVDEFLDLATVPHLVAPSLVEFAQHVILLQHARKTLAVYADGAIKPVDVPAALERLNDDMRTRMAALERFRVPSAAVDQPSEGGFDGTRATPEELMDMPGFVNALADYTYATAPRPNRTLAFAGALAMLSHLVARKYTDARRTMTNLYLVALADSGVGKDHPRKVNKWLADHIEALDGIAEQIGSGEGLEDALFQRHAMLFQMDEFDTVLNVLKESSSIAERIYTYMLNFFGESATSHALRRKALSQEAKEAMAANPTATAKKPTLKIYHPSLSLFATAIPVRFYSSLTMRALENGLLARCLILESGVRGPAGKGPFDAELPQAVTEFARVTSEQDQAMPWGGRVTFRVVPDEPGVPEAAQRIHDEADAFYDKAAKANDTAGKSVWNRGYEITCKLALLYALSENLLDPRVTVRGFEWAWRLVRYSSVRMLAMADAYISVDRDDEDCNVVMRHLADSPGGRAYRGDISRKHHITKVRMDRAEETLVDRGVLKVTPGAHGATVYRLVKKGKGR